MITKRCYACKLEKPVTEFYRSNVKYFQKECKLCCKARRAAWFKTEAGKRSSANTKLKSRFGVTLKDYEVQLKRQDGKCGLCGESSNTLGHRLGFDHNHTTNKLRALLCKPCNLAIGHLKDSPELCEKAAEYLRSWTDKL